MPALPGMHSGRGDSFAYPTYFPLLLRITSLSPRMAFDLGSSRSTSVFLMLILLLALALRLYKLDAYGLFFDEKSTVLISQGISLEGGNQQDVFGKNYFTPQEFWKPKPLQDYFDAHIRGDIGNSPAYYLLLHGWIRLFGLSDFSIRLPSVLFSVLTVWLLFVFTVQHLKSQRLALVAAALAAIEPFFIAYSHQARNYSMSFFFTLLATHLFLNLVRRPSWERRFSAYAAYGLAAMACLFCHYLTFTVLLAHGLYVLFFVKPSRIWVGLAGAIGVGVVGVALWMKVGGGTYTFKTLSDQARFYRTIAQHPPTPNPYVGWIDPTTPTTVMRKLGPILADQFILTNGFWTALRGFRNGLVLILVTALSGWAYVRWERTPSLVYPIVALGGNAAAFFFFSTSKSKFLGAEVAVFLALLLIRYFRKTAQPEERRLGWFFLILSFLPTAFLVFSAFKEGHTVGLTQRYAGFSFPYAILLVALSLREAGRLDKWARIPIFGVLVGQGIGVAGVLDSIYRDISPKYTYQTTARLPNPYWRVAREIEAQFTPGDTIIYPANNRSVFSAVHEEQKQYGQVSPFDAQMVNLYLPPDATYPQRIDPRNADRVWLYQHRTATRRLLFDFKGLTYRY